MLHVVPSSIVTACQGSSLGVGFGVAVSLADGLANGLGDDDAPVPGWSDAHPTSATATMATIGMR